MMFGKDYKGRVAKHLEVFKKAAEGLRQVQRDIGAEVTAKGKEREECLAKAKEHDATIASLNRHHGEIEEKVKKISAFLPLK